MANLRPPRLSVSGLQEARPLRQPRLVRWAVLGGTVVAAVLALAWFDGGEEPLHPIAETVTLPEQEQGM